MPGEQLGLHSGNCYDVSCCFLSSLLQVKAGLGAHVRPSIHPMAASAFMSPLPSRLPGCGRPEGNREGGGQECSVWAPPIPVPTASQETRAIDGARQGSPLCVTPGPDGHGFLGRGCQVITIIIRASMSYRLAMCENFTPNRNCSVQCPLRPCRI